MWRAVCVTAFRSMTCHVRPKGGKKRLRSGVLEILMLVLPGREEGGGLASYTADGAADAGLHFVSQSSLRRGGSHPAAWGVTSAGGN